jgi:hypothetical protein
MPEYTAKRARTRAQLLAAGQELLPGAVRRGLDHALAPGPVAQRADVSRQTWYRYWRADDSAYVEELLAVTLDAGSSRLAQQLAAAATHADPVTDDDDAIEQALLLARAHFRLVTQPRIAIPHMIATALAIEDRYLAVEEGLRPSSAPEIVRRYHERIQVVLVDAYGALLWRWGRRPAPGSDLAHIVNILAALADGFALRSPWNSRPGDDDGDRFARAAVALLEALSVADPGAYRGSGWMRPENPSRVTYG